MKHYVSESDYESDDPAKFPWNPFKSLSTCEGVQIFFMFIFT